MKARNGAQEPDIPVSRQTRFMTGSKMPALIISRLWETICLAHLITETNIKAYVQPVVLFSILSVASGAVTTNQHPTWRETVLLLPRTTLYIWLYLLHFDCSNQKDPESVKEDRLNKPWRAIPSGKLSVAGAERWYIVSACLLILLSGLWLGGFPEAVAVMLETWVYDYANGAGSWWGKNGINTLFYMTGQLGGIRVAANSMTSTSLRREAYEWCVLLGFNTFTTIHIQDLKDQDGDRARGRRTVPLVVGDRTTRWITALFISFWSMTCPAYWGHGRPTVGYILPVLIGFTIAARVLLRRSVKADRIAFQLYTLLWLPALYAVPFLSKYEL
ncbi:UbiA prenyltransferase family-domain-containing protein [Hypoxylon cercidicola]|nr:UbiA prenyltransferase family-domain-containing protein [Hypoxylon cercidicola]